jgi:hypothetical protein
MHHASRGRADGASGAVGLGLPEVPGGRTVDPCSRTRLFRFLRSGLIAL